MMNGYEHGDDQTDFGRDNLCTSEHCRNCYCNKGGRCKWVNAHYKKWIEETTIHGISHVFVGTSPFRRLLWLIIILLATGGCFYNIISQIIEFSNKPTATTITVEPNENGVPFPAVTVCNLNPVRKTYAEEQNILDIIKYLFNPNGLILLNDEAVTDPFHTCRNDLLQSFMNDSNPTLHNVYKDGANDKDDFIHLCRFSADNGTVIPCKDRMIPIITNLGLCYQFNGLEDDGDTIIRSPGTRYGLNLLVNISQDDYAASFGADAGVRVAVHDSHEIPEPDEKGIGVPPGRNALIGLRTEDFKDNSGKTSCSEAGTDLNFFPDVDYSLSACKRNLFLEHVARNCSCLDATTTTPGMERYANLRNCTLNDSCCIYDQYSATNSYSSCLSPCDFRLYVTSTSYSKFPSKFISQDLAALLSSSPESVEEDILSINVFFEDLHAVRSVTDLSFSAVSLLSDIGGQLGLFIGASVISMLEVILLILDLSVDAVKPIPKKCVKLKHHKSDATTKDEEAKEKEAEDSV